MYGSSSLARVLTIAALRTKPYLDIQEKIQFKL